MLAVAFSLGCLTRYFVNLDAPSFNTKFDYQSVVFLGLIFYLSTFFFLSYLKAYKSKKCLELERQIKLYFQAILAALVAQVFLAFLYPFYPTSRLLLISSSAYAFILLIIKEVFLRGFFFYLWHQGFNVRRTLIVSDDEEKIKNLVEQTKKDYLLSLNVVGVITSSGSEKYLAGVPVCGAMDNFDLCLNSHVVDTVVFLDQDTKSDFNRALWQCEERGIEAWLKLDVLDRPISKTSVEYLRGIPFLHFQTGPQNGAALFLKYGFDKMMAVFFLILFAPFFIVVPILIKLTSPGPVFFKQKRAGLGGRTFNIYKFRTMRDGADQERFNVLDKDNEMEGPVFKLKKDPRVTALGAFLRKYSIDEFPQFWNVLKGDMSLVGPRPLRVEEADLALSWQKRRLQMKPGITCIWQVSGRSDITDFEKWVKLDLEYIDNWSIWLDIKLLLKTVPVVLVGTGSR